MAIGGAKRVTQNDKKVRNRFAERYCFGDIVLVLLNKPMTKRPLKIRESPMSWALLGYIRACGYYTSMTALQG